MVKDLQRHGVRVKGHVPAAFVLQWWCEVVATPIAYAAELGPWVLVPDPGGLGFELAPGLTVIRGPNGAGKSTLQRAIELGLTRKVTSGAAVVHSSVPGRSTGSSGVASVPEGSETATPQRALP